MIGSVNPDSFDTFHSYANTFQMPFITPWFPEKVKFSFFFIKNIFALVFKITIIVNNKNDRIFFNDL